jgi:hypothetical protein
MDLRMGLSSERKEAFENRVLGQDLDLRENKQEAGNVA